MNKTTKDQWGTTQRKQRSRINTTMSLVNGRRQRRSSFRRYSFRNAIAGSIREALHAGAYPAATAAASRRAIAAATANGSFAFIP